ncbi:MAG: hypothetical protein NTX65_03225 [Ignavibacteriales bacterium]|nr:hypothetical protein [Ignavibacteriales bacterium]
MDSKQDIYEFFFGIREANTKRIKGYRNTTIELENKIFDLVFEKLYLHLVYFFKNNPSLKCDFDNETIEEGSYKFRIYLSIRDRIISFIESKMPPQIESSTIYTINYYSLNPENGFGIQKQKHAEIKPASKSLYNKSIDIYLIDVKELLNEIDLKHLSFIEDISNHLDSVAKMKNIPKVNEHIIIKKARDLYKQKTKSKKKKDNKYSRREALIEANEIEGYLFKEIEISTIKHRKEEKLLYLESKKFTKSLEDKWDIRFEVEEKNKMKERSDKKKGGTNRF